MKRIFSYISFILLICFCFVQCAKRGTPSGGPEDTTPPRFVRSTPENYSTNFNSREIRIYFDEYVKVNNPQQQIIISPPMDPRPEITPLGTASRSIRIRINDTLQENTTYAINFGRSIVDNNANNPLPYFKYVFSTGSYIDSLSVSGNIRDAVQSTPENFVSVMLYEVDSTYTDSAVYNRTPTYVTNTLDSASTFELSNLKAGTYRLVALKDNNNNYKFEPRQDKIGFVENFIEVPTNTSYTLNLFKEVPEFTMSRPSQTAQQHILFGYAGKFDLDSLSITPISAPEDFEQRIVKDPQTDTLHYFFKPEIPGDTLRFIASHKNYYDTLTVRMTSVEKDSLRVTTQPTGTLSFNDSLRLTANIPFRVENETLFSLTDIDTVPVPFTTKYLRNRNELIFNFEKEENQVYSFTALPGAIRAFFDSTNDSIALNLRTRNYSDYGNLNLTLGNTPNFPVLVQLTSEKGEVQFEQYGENQSFFDFRNIPSGKYLIRVVFDENRNREWDTGNYLEKTHPERISYFPEVIDLRANWDVSQTFILE